MEDAAGGDNMNLLKQQVAHQYGDEEEENEDEEEEVDPRQQQYQDPLELA